MYPPLLVLVLASSAFVAPAHSTSFFEAPFSEALGEAPIFVRGIVGNSTVASVNLPDGSQAPFTYWDLKVTEVIQGRVKGSQIRFRQLGGEKDGVGMSVSGGAEFSPGEEVVLMLDEPSAAAGDSAYPLRGLSTGKYVVKKDAAGTEYLLGAGIHQDSRNASGDNNGHLTLAEVRRMAHARKAAAVPSPRSTGIPAKLLGEKTSSPKIPASDDRETESFAPPQPSRFDLSRVWILIAGAALGVWWYRMSRNRRR